MPSVRELRNRHGDETENVLPNDWLSDIYNLGESGKNIVCSVCIKRMDINVFSDGIYPVCIKCKGISHRDAAGGSSAFAWLDSEKDSRPDSWNEWSADYE
jgi:hypothetical protein